jgi:hypothetical protein
MVMIRLMASSNRSSASGGSPPDCKSEQANDNLQVVLYPVMNFFQQKNILSVFGLDQIDDSH